MKQVIYFVLLSLLVIACKPNKGLVEIEKPTGNLVGGADNQPAIIYKTIRDFSDFVPVLMNTGRTEIVSYPAPGDLCSNGKFSKPTTLKNGYMLDSRGITVNVVFLNYTYEVYSQLKEAPAQEEMLKNIKEKYPLKELIYCGSRYQYKDEINELNKLIDAGFPGCKKADIVPMQVTFDK